MPRRILKKIMPSPGSLQKQWFLRLFGNRLLDPRLWALHRRGVTAAVAAGLAICFIPLPVHMILAGCLAVFLRLNLPAIFGTIFIVNPVTAVPVYYTAYRVGLLLTGADAQAFDFHFGIENGIHLGGLAAIWKPFFTGCLACGVIAGSLGWVGLELVWRWSVIARRHRRHRQHLYRPGLTP
jgi:uncharacterized protein (DUF2062 family)